MMKERAWNWAVIVAVLAALVGLLVVQRPPAVRAAPTAAIKVMPLGDSITSGTDQSYSHPMASYRCQLYQKLTAAGYNVDFVGSVHGQWGVNGVPLTPVPSYCNMGDLDEEGHSGWAIYHILSGVSSSWTGNLQSWATTYKPDVVLIHLGTNNFINDPPDYPDIDVNHAITQMGQVIDTLRTANPRVRILLAKLIPCRFDQNHIDRIPQFNDLLPGLAASKSKPYSPIVVVDMYTDFDTNNWYVNDSLYTHPNPTGEAWMADQWKAGFDKIMKINNWTFVPRVTN